MVFHIVRQVDSRHPALAQLALYGVAARERGAEAVQLVQQHVRPLFSLNL